MEYLSIKQTSEKWGISVRRIQTLCVEGRISGAVKIGYSWIIPRTAEKPADARIKSGRYVKPMKMNYNHETRKEVSIDSPEKECGRRGTNK